MFADTNKRFAEFSMLTLRHHYGAENEGILFAVVPTPSADSQLHTQLPTFHQDRLGESQKVGLFLVARRSPSGEFGSFCVILCLCPHQPQSCESFHGFRQLHASLLQVCVESNMFSHSSSSSVRFSNRSWGNEWGNFGAFLRTHSPSWCSLFPKLLYLVFYTIKDCLCIKVTIIIVFGKL